MNDNDIENLKDELALAQKRIRDLEEELENYKGAYDTALEELIALEKACDTAYRKVRQTA